MLTWFKALGLSAMTFMVPIKPMLIGSLIAVLFDTISGVMAARKRGERISSAGLRRTVSKGFIYSTTILVAYVIQRTLLEDALPVAKLVAAAIGVVEGKSILENVQTISGQPLFKSILDKFGSVNDPAKPKGTPPDAPKP